MMARWPKEDWRARRLSLEMVPSTRARLQVQEMSTPMATAATWILELNAVAHSAMQYMRVLLNMAFWRGYFQPLGSLLF